MFKFPRNLWKYMKIPDDKEFKIHLRIWWAIFHHLQLETLQVQDVPLTPKAWGSRLDMYNSCDARHLGGTHNWFLAYPRIAIICCFPKKGREGDSRHIRTMIYNDFRNPMCQSPGATCYNCGKCCWLDKPRMAFAFELANCFSNRQPKLKPFSSSKAP